MGIVYSSVVGGLLRDVFDWHARPGALVRLSPPWQPVRVVQESASLRDGTAILGMPGGVRWIARHKAEAYRPPDVFVDQLEGPLSVVLSWRHQHDFAAEGEARTRVTDKVDTPVPEFLLRPMFEYRHRQLALDLAAHAAFSTEPLTVAVSGASSVVGTAFTALLTTGGHRVVRVAHRPEQPYWSPESLEGVDGVVHLLRDAPIDAAESLARLAADSGARVFVHASSDDVAASGIRTVCVRNGSLRGGPVWIALDDLGDIYLRALVDDGLAGLVDAVSPDSQGIRPARLLDRGHRFRFHTRAQYRAHVRPWRTHRSIMDG